MTDKKRPCAATQDQKGDENSPTALYPDGHILSIDEVKQELYHAHLHYFRACMALGLNEHDGWREYDTLVKALAEIGAVEKEEKNGNLL